MKRLFYFVHSVLFYSMTVLPQSDFFLSLTLFCPNQFVCYAMFVLL